MCEQEQEEPKQYKNQDKSSGKPNDRADNSEKEKYEIMISVAIAVIINVALAPNWYQISPANEFANIVKILWKPEKVPIAVAVSFLSVMLLIHAFEMPSVAAA